tara:strand:- start:1167 stop:1355 length:189 start_codon:yes stop_codon:yes gene_type:complete
MKVKRETGLRERIARSETPKKISHLLGKGKKFSYASERTKRSWENTAAMRLKAWKPKNKKKK